jgi:hypothetical protein
MQPECSECTLERLVFNFLQLALHLSLCQNRHRRIAVKTNPISMKCAFVIMYVYMYVCIRVGHKTSPCTKTFNDLLCLSVLLQILIYFCICICTVDWSQWPHGQRHEPASPHRTLGSWVRNPLKAWASVSMYSVFVLFCEYSVLCYIHKWKKSYRLRNILLQHQKQNEVL